jgi:hypothetical protein
MQLGEHFFLKQKMMLAKVHLLKDTMLILKTCLPFAPLYKPPLPPWQNHSCLRAAISIIMSPSLSKFKDPIKLVIDGPIAVGRLTFLWHRSGHVKLILSFTQGNLPSSLFSKC